MSSRGAQGFRPQPAEVSLASVGDEVKIKKACE